MRLTIATLALRACVGPAAARGELRRRRAEPRAQGRTVQRVDAQPRAWHAAAGGRRADPLQELDPETPQRVGNPDHGARVDLAIRMVCASLAGDEGGPQSADRRGG